MHDDAERVTVKSEVVHKDEKGDIVKTYDMEIEVYLPVREKPYLGGYRSLKNSLVYHHAYAQTDQKYREHSTKYHREVGLRDIVQTYNSLPLPFHLELDVRVLHEVNEGHT